MASNLGAAWLRHFVMYEVIRGDEGLDIVESGKCTPIFILFKSVASGCGKCHRISEAKW